MATETTTGNGAGAMPATETVEMSDGRKVDFVGKRKMLKHSEFAADGRWVFTRFDFKFEISDEYPENTITVRAPAHDRQLKDGSYALDSLAAHGAEQKFGDSAAGEDDVEDMYEAVKKTVDQFAGGDWSQRREGGGMAGTSILLRALVIKNPKRSVQEARDLLKTLDAKTKLALRNSPDLKPIVEKLESERASKAAKVDTSGVLANW
jgi:hypothetical protein